VDSIQFTGQRDREIRARQRIFGVTAIHRVTGEDRPIAQIFHRVTAIPAITVCSAHPGNSHARSDWRFLTLACDDFADDLVTRNQLRPKRRQVTFDDVQIRATHATGEDAKQQMSRDKLRDDDSLFLYQKKVKGKASSAVYGLLPHDVAEELRNVPRNAYTHPSYFFWSARSKRKSEVSNWIKIFGKILAKATATHPKLFLDADGSSRPAHLHMLRDTFAVEYLLAGMPLEEVSRLLGHSSVLITQKHYAPWVLERQQRLATSVRTAWSTMGLNTAAPVINIADGRSGKVVRRAARS